MYIAINNRTHKLWGPDIIGGQITGAYDYAFIHNNKNTLFLITCFKTLWVEEILQKTSDALSNSEIMWSDLRK